jgi:hypothetical protein
MVTPLIRLKPYSVGITLLVRINQTYSEISLFIGKTTFVRLKPQTST